MNIKELYKDRKLSKGYPDLESKAHDWFSKSQQVRRLKNEEGRINTLFDQVSQIVDLKKGSRVLVLGCGPTPQMIEVLRAKGFHATGVEPVKSFVESAREMLGDKSLVLEGAAEHIPLPDASQDVVIFDSVLEHVDSIPQSLNEIYRVMAPSGILYLHTTNKHRFSFKGFNDEFTTPFYNWFPRLIKECYVHHHLHFKPSLANYTTRPAVHWPTYAELCARGRDAGFSKFYSIIDVLQPDGFVIQRSRLRRLIFSNRVLSWFRHKPLLRALILTQLGGSIFMFKR